MAFHMDKSGVPSTNPVLGPEWLAKDPHKEKEPVLHSDGVLNVPNPTSALHSPRTLGRSRSQPLFEDVPKERNDVSVFSMIQERNSFDRNFPTLNAASRKSSNGQSTSSAWNQPKKTTPTPPKSPPPTEEVEFAPRLRHSTGNTRDSVLYHTPVPLPPPKSGRPSRELLLLPSKKRDTPKIPRHFDMSILRKATSDPNLPITGEYDNVPAKMVAPKKKDKTNIGNAGSGSDGGLHTNSDRNDFFQDLIRKEAQLKKEGGTRISNETTVHKTNEETTPAEVPSPPVLEVPPPVEAPKIEPELETRKKSSSFSIEDEERFLRNLGWTPEEEDPIPELTSEEILAVTSLIDKKKAMKWPQRAAQTVL